MKNLLKIKKLLLRNVMPLFFKLFPIRKQYLFSSYYGKYTDSPKNISEYLHEVDPNAKIYWICDIEMQTDIFPPYVIPVKINTIKSIYLLWTSKYLIDNCQKQIVYRIRKKQLYLQTWHGTPLKKIEFDARHKLPKHYLNYSRVDNQSITYLLVGNEYSENVYQTALRVSSSRYVRSGIPRNDVFFSDKAELVTSIRKQLNIDENCFVVLYAPTFRNSVYEKNDSKNGFTQIEQLNPNLLCEMFLKKFKRKCVILTHFHPNVSKKIDSKFIFSKYGGKVQDVTNDCQTEDLLCVADLLITDYSSIFFDYALMEKPIILFTYDYLDYIQERGTYLNINELPITHATTAIEICKILEENSLDELSEKTRDLNSYVGNYECGKATDIAVNLITKNTQ
ncbi:CDP-glycerol glycerophosphotransferase family protein [Lactiplantibacillus sp. DA1]|uniref:CDP-glycerol glycerophosphotransferase family protein n=1 Tax=Lactiplantibacillus sp. DA1 TaxID=3079857 RepID=UPI00292A640B|nr:CDP-glycerol glycerophosphotransferase family protein [Lactiplantibacillus sp. DA1]MDV0432227.1 CDP-glycerol glycerophosphotransferase family protein [Lactiplantibacillus sp. DA1]